MTPSVQFCQDLIRFIFVFSFFVCAWFTSNYFFCTTDSVSSLPLAGCGPAATHFSCFAKKSEQKKATQVSLPFGYPIAQCKNGESQKLATLKHLPLFFPFLPSTIGSATCGNIKTYNHNGRMKINRLQRVKSLNSVYMQTGRAAFLPFRF